MAATNTNTIVLYPSPGIGHLISMVELGKLILTHHPSFSISITILITTTTSFDTGSTASYLRHVSATTPSITFHHLPIIPMDPTSFPSTESITFELLRLNTPHLRRFLLSLSLSSSIAAFIIDLFCSPALPLARQLNIPTYYFFTSGAACLDCLLYFPTIHQNTNQSFQDLRTDLQFPNLPPIPAADMPKPMLKRSNVEYQCFLDLFTQMPKSDGIIVNTFEALEPMAVKAISDGLCVPDGVTPPLFCIGPLIASVGGRGSGGGGGDGEECLAWLDTQPSRSVVFLCFGSGGLFTGEQLTEIAIGLERSGQRFLWVVRAPSKGGQVVLKNHDSDLDLDLFLPDGFLDRTKGRGLVVRSWAPQTAVLRHDSVGGFVTHCGWNSVLEAVCAGVPMVAWPLYAEQRLNRVLLVKEMKLALWMNETESGFVTAEEVEKRVSELMNAEEGKAVRDRVKAASEGAREAMSEGGSSRVALAKLVESWEQS